MSCGGTQKGPDDIPVEDEFKGQDATSEGKDTEQKETIQNKRPSTAGKDNFTRAGRIVKMCLHVDTSSDTEPICVELEDSELEWLLEESNRIALSQPSLLHLRAPISIIGDIHGQYKDLLRIFQTCGWPEDGHFLFLGDYVDRGKNGLECCILLLALKVQYPEKVFMLRGNHECASINRVYGFFEEVKKRYSQTIWLKFCKLFDSLPIAALVEERIFCIHGGLSPNLHHLDQITAIERPIEVPDRGLLCDFLWSDPDVDVEGWAESDRGVSFTFGQDIVQDFLKTNDLDLIVRAHQVVEDGYEFFADRGLVTIFSAPNYCGEFDNAGAILRVDEELMVSFSILKPTNAIEFGYVGIEAETQVKQNTAKSQQNSRSKKRAYM